MEAHQERYVDKMLSFVTDDTVLRRAGSDFTPRNGKEEVRSHWLAVFDTFPDLREDIMTWPRKVTRLSPRQEPVTQGRFAPLLLPSDVAVLCARD